MPAPVVHDLPRLLRDRHAAEAIRLHAHHITTRPQPLAPDPTSPAGRRALRGIPVAGAAAGTSPGTNPLAHALGNCDCEACIRNRRTLR